MGTHGQVDQAEDHNLAEEGGREEVEAKVEVEAQAEVFRRVEEEAHNRLCWHNKLRQ